MAMKYYSDVTKRFYDTEDACVTAEKQELDRVNEEKIRKEKEAQELKLKKEAEAAERKAAAAKVDEARKAMVAAQKNYRDVLEDFISKYKTYHYSTNNVADIPTLFEIVNRIFD